MIILHVENSASDRKSLCGLLAVEFLAAWKELSPADTVTHRDLCCDPIVARARQRRDALVDELVEELMVADICLFAIPVYFYTVPPTFKTYVDAIARTGRTFAPGPLGRRSLLQERRVLVLSARAWDDSWYRHRQGWRCYQPYLRTVLSTIGVTDITHVAVTDDPLLDNERGRARKMEEARATVRELAIGWAAAPVAPVGA